MADQLLQNVYDTVRHDFTDPIPTDTQILGGISRFSDKCLVNCFTIGATAASSNGMGMSVEKYIYKRPAVRRVVGMDFNSILGVVNSTPVANAVMTSLNDVYVAAYYDDTNAKHVIMQYRPITGTTTKIGEILTTTQNDDVFLTEMTIANVCTLGVVWNKADGTTSKGYFATSGAAGFAAASLTEIVDVDFPPKRGTPLPLVGPMVQMNGTAYVMTNTGEIVNSDLNSITSWNSLGTIQAISYPDQGVGLCRYKSHLVAFGEDSIEFFNDVGQPPPKSPLARTEQAFIKFGALTARAVLAVDDTIYFIAKSGSGTDGLFRLEGYTPVKVSDGNADWVLANLSASYPQVNCALLSCITMFGAKQICIGGAVALPWLATGTITFTQMMFNINEREFWFFEANQTRSEVLLGVSQYQLTNNQATTQYILLGQADASFSITKADRYTTIHSITATGNYADRYGSDSNSSNYFWIIQTNKLWWGTEKRKRIHKVKALLDTTQLTSSAGTLTIGWLKGLYDQLANNAPTSRSITFPHVSQRYYATNLGQARTWQFIITIMNNNWPGRIKALEFDLSQAAS